VRTAGGATTYLRDVANVRDGFQPQTNIVRQDGQRGVLLSVLKNGGASTLDIVKNLRAMLPIAGQQLPPDVKVTPLFDQSIFVTAAIEGVVAEALIAALLTAAMVLLFLGNWRSTLIIAVTIPLSILASILVLFALGETLNIMTLGGLALSVGILVDQAIVTIENIERHLHEGKPLLESIEVGAGEIGVPAFVSTLCICIVFVPMFFLTGVARFLFVPLAEAVVFAMLASYFLSRTLVPTLVMLLMKQHGQDDGAPGPLRRVYLAFDRQFERLRGAYAVLLDGLLAKKGRFGSIFLLFCVVSCGLVPFLGRDFFPSVDAGQIRLHMRTATGTRIEETARIADQVENAIRQLLPETELETILDNLGIPNSGINLSYSNAGTIGTLDGEILLSLKKGHRPTEEWVSLLRRELPKRFPGVEFFFQPADIVTQILNFGLPAAIDVQFTGSDVAGNAELAAELTKAIRKMPGAVDAHVHQRLDGPMLTLQMDRTRLQQLGLNGHQRRPERADRAVGQLADRAGLLARSAQRRGLQRGGAEPAVHGGLDGCAAQHPGGHGHRRHRPAAAAGQPGDAQPARQLPVVSRYNIAPAIDVFVSVQGTDLGSVAGEVRKLVDEIRPKLKRGNRSNCAGQVQTMQNSFTGLGVGLAMAIVLVYLLVVVNFQSLDRRRHHHCRPARRAGRHRVDPVHHRHHAQRAGLDGRHHDHGRGHGQLHPGGVVRPPAARGRVRPLQAAQAAGATRIRPVLMTAWP
jgi:multidrug efflux pump subunit AcrB